jgi:hypothetical protein
MVKVSFSSSHFRLLEKNLILGLCSLPSIWLSKPGQGLLSAPSDPQPIELVLYAYSLATPRVTLEQHLFLPMRCEEHSVPSSAPPPKVPTSGSWHHAMGGEGRDLALSLKFLPGRFSCENYTWVSTASVPVSAPVQARTNLWFSQKNAWQSNFDQTI